MDETMWTLIDIVGPIILLVLLIWVVMRSRRRRGEPPQDVTERATREAYRAEEEMRREGTDDR
jgi:cytochrome c-type biogenesis protein CcmH/NrfF